MSDAPTTKEGIDVQPRTCRAATESMALDRYAGNTGEYDVYSESGSVYRVDLIAGSCSCPDDEHNAPAGGCKHVRRVEMAIGQREIPDFDRETDVERMMAARERVQAHTATREAVVATDGGQVVATDDSDETAYTTHYEAPKHGGEKYVRCEGCGRELLSELGGRDRLPHAPDCPNAEH